MAGQGSRQRRRHRNVTQSRRSRSVCEEDYRGDQGVEAREGGGIGVARSGAARSPVIAGPDPAIHLKRGTAG